MVWELDVKRIITLPRINQKKNELPSIPRYFVDNDHPPT